MRPLHALDLESVTQEPRGGSPSSATHVHDRLDSQIGDHVFPNFGAKSVSVQFCKATQVGLVPGTAVNLTLVDCRFLVRDANRGQGLGFSLGDRQGIGWIPTTSSTSSSTGR